MLKEKEAEMEEDPASLSPLMDSFGEDGVKQTTNFTPPAYPPPLPVDPPFHSQAPKEGT